MCDVCNVHCTFYAADLSVLISLMWDFRFSQPWWWRLKSSGTLHWIDSLIWYIFTEGAGVQYYCFSFALTSKQHYSMRVFVIYFVYIYYFSYIIAVSLVFHWDKWMLVLSGPQFALHCVNHLLLPMVQNWLRKTGRIFRGWDNFAPNFKQCCGLATDLVVDFLTQLQQGEVLFWF